MYHILMIKGRYPSILNRWTEYCSELYNHETNGDNAVLDCNQLPLGGGGAWYIYQKNSLSLDMQEKNILAHKGVQKNNLASKVREKNNLSPPIKFKKKNIVCRLFHWNRVFIMSLASGGAAPPRPPFL